MPLRIFFFLLIRRPPRSTLFPYNDALPISTETPGVSPSLPAGVKDVGLPPTDVRSEEHTSELQSHVNLVCRLLLEKKKYTKSLTWYMMPVRDARAGDWLQRYRWTSVLPLMD